MSEWFHYRNDNLLLPHGLTWLCFKPLMSQGSRRYCFDTAARPGFLVGTHQSNGTRWHAYVSLQHVSFYAHLWGDRNLTRPNRGYGLKCRADSEHHKDFREKQDLLRRSLSTFWRNPTPWCNHQARPNTKMSLTGQDTGMTTWNDNPPHMRQNKNLAHKQNKTCKSGALFQARTLELQAGFWMKNT